MGENKENNFKVPKGYFDNFHERLMDKIHKEERSEAVSPIPKSDGFVAPKGYFNNFNQKVLIRKGKKETRIISLKSHRRFYHVAAAVAAIFLLIFGLNWKMDAPIAFEDLAHTEIDAYFDTTELDLNTYEIVEAVFLDGLELNDVLENQLNEENILEYLDENVEDTEDLNLNYNDYK